MLAPAGRRPRACITAGLVFHPSCGTLANSVTVAVRGSPGPERIAVPRQCLPGAPALAQTLWSTTGLSHFTVIDPARNSRTVREITHPTSASQPSTARSGRARVPPPPSIVPIESSVAPRSPTTHHDPPRRPRGASAPDTPTHAHACPLTHHSLGRSITERARNTRTHPTPRAAFHDRQKYPRLSRLLAPPPPRAENIPLLPRRPMRADRAPGSHLLAVSIGDTPAIFSGWLRGSLLYRYQYQNKPAQNPPCAEVSARNARGNPRTAWTRGRQAAARSNAPTLQRSTAGSTRRTPRRATMPLHIPYSYIRPDAARLSGSTAATAAAVAAGRNERSNPSSKITSHQDAGD